MRWLQGCSNLKRLRGEENLHKGIQLERILTGIKRGDNSRLIQQCKESMRSPKFDKNWGSERVLLEKDFSTKN